MKSSSYRMVMVVSIFVLIISLFTLSYNEKPEKENFSTNEPSALTVPTPTVPGSVGATTVTATPSPNTKEVPPAIDLSDIRQQMNKLESVSKTPPAPMKDVDVEAVKQIIGSSGGADLSEKYIPPVKVYGSSENIKGSNAPSIDFSALTARNTKDVVKESFAPMPQSIKFQPANW